MRTPSLSWAFFLWLATSLAGFANARAEEMSVYPGAAWGARQPEQVGLDAPFLDRFAERVGGDGYLVKSWGDATRHGDWASAANPMLSTLLMLAVQERRVASVDAQVKDLGRNLPARHAPMTFRHRANMVSGYALDEPPGAAWAYNDFAIQLYAKSLEKVFGGSLGLAFRERLELLRLEDGEVFGSRNGMGVTASTRAFSRLGWLWLNRGRWADRQVLDPRLFDDCFRVGVPAPTPRAATRSNDYLKIGSYGGGTNQTPHGPGVYGFNLWFNAALGLGQRVWPALPADAYQANGRRNRDTLTVIPSWRMVVALRGAWPGSFEPGKPDGEYNQNLSLIARAVQRSPGQPAEAALTEPRKVARWHPEDFAFTHEAKLDNPFRVRFSATVTRPDGSRFEVPGFFDGENVWKVRVSSNAEGAWSLATHSDQPGLDGRKTGWTCVANPNPRIHGSLRVDAEHPHHFVYEDGQRFFMMGYECDWLWALDAADPELRTVKPFVDTIATHGFNYLIMNTYAHDTGWRAGKTGNDDHGPPLLYAWEGSNERPDHGRLNLAYWRHYDRIMRVLFERGIVAHVMLKVYNKKVRWPERGSADDDLFFRSVVARYAAYPNVVWDFSKEAHNEKNLAYKLGRLRFVRDADPYHHLITTHDDTANYDAGAFDATNDFRSDQQHAKFRETILAQRALRAWPVANVEFGYEQGPKGPDDKTYGVAQTPEAYARRAWEVAMAGGYTAYYYTYTAWDVIRPADKPVGYAYFQWMREFFELTRYWELEPATGVASAGWVLANPGQEYVAYQQSPVEFALSLPGNRSGYSGVWFQPFSGRRAAAAALVKGKQAVRPPAGWEGPAVLHVTAGPQDQVARRPIPQLDPIDVSPFGSGIQHWRKLRDEARFIKVERDQPSYPTSQVREIVDNILLYQRSNGGWPKDYDMTAVLSADQRAQVVATHGRPDSSYDNGNIHSQVGYLARAVAQVDEPAWRAACQRGFDFIVRSQFDNGGFPQGFPGAAGYHAHITFNDGVMIGALNVLKDAADGAVHFSWLDEDRRQQARRAVERGVACILRCQIRVNGVLTGWCQQHDERTLEARPARTFELASICPQETTEIARFLMRQSTPSPEVIRSVDAAVAWLKQVRLSGIRVEKVKSTQESYLRHDTDFDVVVTPDPNAKPIWARHYEIGTDRPVFAGRDAVKKYALAEIERERRTGTPWYGGWPQPLIERDYPRWKQR